MGLYSQPKDAPVPQGPLQCHRCRCEIWHEGLCDACKRRCREPKASRRIIEDDCTEWQEYAIRVMEDSGN